MTQRTIEHARRRALSWERAIRADSPLYGRLARHVAGSDELLDLVRIAPPEQLEMNLLFAAVQSLLLAGERHPLADWYPALGGRETGPGLESAFTDFVLMHRAAIADAITTRRVQTNEVARCTFLLPAYNRVAQLSAQSLAIIEIGTSAGLTQNIDRYGYRYTSEAGSQQLGEASPVQLECDTGATLPLGVAEIPTIGWRTGLDIHPIDVTDSEQARWLQALVWPDQIARHRALAAAIDVALAHPPSLVAGGALDVLPELLAAAPAHCALVVQHSFVLTQLSAADRETLYGLIDAAAEESPIYRVGAEWVSDSRVTELEVTIHGRNRRTMPLGLVHHHGRWIDLSHET